MKVLLYGSKGWIGSMFSDVLINRGHAVVEPKQRVENMYDVKVDIEFHKPTHVVCMIGRTHGENVPNIDYLEQKGKIKENVRDNLFAPMMLAHICTEKKIHFTYLGTGCIFNYDDTGRKFEVSDKPNYFGSAYSVVKGYTDQMMKFYPKSVLNLRIRMPICSQYNPRNFITKITKYEKICSIPNSMTVLDEMLPYTCDMMETGMTGTVNLTNPGTISHNEILEMYKKHVDPKFTYQNFTLEEQSKILKADRSNNELCTKYLEKLFPNVTPIKKAVETCLMKYKLPDNILVTGGCGFIGSNFINHYFPQMKFDKLVNLDAMYYCSDRNNVDEKIRENSRYVLVEGKCQDEKLVRELLVKYHITHVIHFAAQSHVTNSFGESIQYTEDNVKGTHTLVEECRRWGRIKRFIHVSTDEVYGDKMKERQTEQNIFCPTNPYAATKAGAELMVQSYYHSFNFPVIITRGNNVYGKNQYPEKVIPRFIQNLREGKKIQVEGDGEQTRGFLHVDDACKAFQLILEKGEIGEIYNIGSDNDYSINQLAKEIVHHFWESNTMIEHVTDRPYNDKRYHVSNQKLKDLGWSQKIHLSEGLKKLI